MDRPVVHLISGPSSVGKSTFIEQHLPPDIELLFPWQLAKLAPGSLPSRSALHYNILRPWYYASRRSRARRLFGSRSPSFDADAPLQSLLALGAEIHAVVLVASRAGLERRMGAREHFEVSTGKLSGYPGDEWLAILEQCRIEQVYADWIAFLEGHRVPFDIYDSDATVFRRIESVSDLYGVLAHDA